MEKEIRIKEFKRRTLKNRKDAYTFVRGSLADAGFDLQKPIQEDKNEERIIYRQEG